MSHHVSSSELWQSTGVSIVCRVNIGHFRIISLPFLFTFEHYQNLFSNHRIESVCLKLKIMLQLNWVFHKDQYSHGPGYPTILDNRMLRSCRSGWLSERMQFPTWWREKAWDVWRRSVICLITPAPLMSCIPWMTWIQSQRNLSIKAGSSIPLWEQTTHRDFHHWTNKSKCHTRKAWKILVYQ